MSDDERKPIDDILKPSAQPSEPAPKEPVSGAPEPKVDSTGRLHGDGGKFATKSPKADTSPVQTGVKPQEPVAPPATEKSQPQPTTVPVSALIDQRLEARQAKQERDELRRQLAELQKPKAEPIDFFADPEAALNQRLQPLQQRFDSTVSSLTLRASKAEAIAVHGKKAVDEMEAAIGQAMEAGDPEMQQLRAHLLQSDDPVGIAMQWHQRKAVLNEVGTDPAAYREKLKAEIIAELNGGQPPEKPNGAAPVMPSNIAGARNVGTRSGPTWTGPTPLTDIFKR